MKVQMSSKWLWWLTTISCVFILGWIDWLTGFELNFFVFYFIPVSVAAWYLGLGEAVIISVFCALVWFGADKLTGHSYSSNVYAVWNTIIRLCSFLSIGWSVHKIHKLIISEKDKSEALQKSLAEIKVLESFLSICCQCKKIRNDSGQWQQMEAYISEHSDTTFSHGYCPECAKRLLEEAGFKKR